ncbi:uncharacterized protein C8Q71DRAFT_715745 [Rhodofomes roseus]|uniref:Uncharacterized protein n=1 Tax=Rhodofomes roseus TaxID=34475 RepID=A0A4Y9Y1A4_9APHY|nr:uncharacterized protein C8Q71DRAFT_715745 [Rhodofomes roseus]KAH9831215.1 hypothetical protein C8Q71DRAFT_715745 [Rhodofomes roseus]TFY55852.1 hypothetical protein EVJ58_g7989 [Rhodofomes roseus]
MFRSTNPEQTYVSLIHQNSNYYASWDPARLVRVGDYGHLQADGSFATEGNIFSKGWAAEFGVVEIRGPTNSTVCIQSSDVEEVRGTAAGSIGASWAHRVTAKKTFIIRRSHGAILIMLEPQYTQLSPPGTLKDLVYSTALKKRHLLVSELYSCASYARLLAPRQEHVVNISLEGEAHQRLFHGRAEAEWRHTADGGDFRCGVQQGGDVAFTPLFRLVGRKTFRKLPITELARPTWRRVVAAAGPQNRVPSPRGSFRSDEIKDHEDEPEYEEVQGR